MTRHTPEVVTGHHYCMTKADFTGGIVVTDAASGREMMCGTTRLGVHMTTYLDTPLCKSCDSPIDASGYCSSCEVIHADLGGETIGDPFLNRRKAA